MGTGNVRWVNPVVTKRTEEACSRGRQAGEKGVPGEREDSRQNHNTGGNFVSFKLLLISPLVRLTENHEGCLG